MKKQLFALLAVSFTLAGCFNNGADTEEEVDGEADDATSEEEEADELLNEEEEEHSRESENDVDSVAPEPVVHTETFEREGEEVEVGVTYILLSGKMTLLFLPLSLKKSVVRQGLV